jgi:hypothetical protein
MEVDFECVALMPSATYFCNDAKVGKKSPLKCRGGCTAQIPFVDAWGIVAYGI